MSRAPNSTSTIFTAEFHQEFQAETASLLRRRFLWFCAIVGLLVAVSMTQGRFFVDFRATGEGVTSQPTPVRRIVYGIEVLLFAGAFLIAKVKRPSDQDLLRLSYLLVTAFGLLQILAGLLSPGVQETQGLTLFIQVLVVHLLACIFLPWTWRQAAAPALVLSIVAAAAALISSNGSRLDTVVSSLVATPLAVLPGVFVCWLRQYRRLHNLKFRFISRRYNQVRRELVDARRIHEALFPSPVKDGLVRFGYLYEPMHLIGGDFLHAHFSPCDDGENHALSVVIMDVTGHGIPAALTVNRLSGELHRLFAEDPAIAPGDVLRLMNRYVHLTLATHSVFVTALCIRVDPLKGTLIYASGGHPPAFLRAVDGTVEELESTAFVLGACPDRDFDPAPREIPFGPGDSVIAYTDGATECRNQHGKMLGIHGLRRVMAAPYSPEELGWPGRLLAAVEKYRHGPPADDTLVVEVFRSLDRAPRPDIPKSAEHLRPAASAEDSRDTVPS